MISTKFPKLKKVKELLWGMALFVLRYFAEMPAKIFTAQVIRKDGAGDGNFGASRFSSKHGSYSHRGIDLLAAPGDIVKAPFSGQITRIARPYETGGNENTGFVFIDEKGREWRFFYANPMCTNCHIEKGQPLAIMQDIAARYPGPMLNHLHVEVRENGDLLDPGKVLNLYS